MADLSTAERSQYVAGATNGPDHRIPGLGVAEAVCDALQQRVHALSLLIFPFFSLMKGGELHPARNPWIGAGIDKECGDR